MAFFSRFSLILPFSTNKQDQKNVLLKILWKFVMMFCFKDRTFNMINYKYQSESQNIYKQPANTINSKKRTALEFVMIPKSSLFEYINVFFTKNI